MKTIIILTCFLFVIITGGAAEPLNGKQQDFQEYFEKVVRDERKRLKDTGWNRSEQLYIPRSRIHILLPLAQKLVAHPQVNEEYLFRIANKQGGKEWEDSDRLAKLTLAISGRDKSLDYLYDLICQNHHIQRGNKQLLYYMSVSSLRKLAQKFIKEPKKKEFRDFGANLLAMFGDEQAVKTLKMIYQNDRNNKAYKKAIEEIEWRINNVPPNKLNSWYEMEIVYNRGITRFGLSIIQGYGKTKSAVWLNTNSTLSNQFLKRKIYLGDAVALRLVTLQKKKEMIPDILRLLKSYKEIKTWRQKREYDEAMWALIGLEYEKSVDVIMPRFIPGSESNKHIFAKLSYVNWRVSEEVFELLKKDERFKKDIPYMDKKVKRRQKYRKLRELKLKGKNG